MMSQSDHKASSDKSSVPKLLKQTEVIEISWCKIINRYFIKIVLFIL